MKLEGTPEEIIRKMAGQKLPLTNGWGSGVVVGAWKLKGEVRLLLAWPNADNPDQLFNEAAKDITPPEPPVSPPSHSHHAISKPASRQPQR